MEIKIKELFKNLIPPLTEESFKSLENDIITRGVIDPLITWKGYLVDGHHRYQIIQKYNLPFKTEELTGIEKEGDVLLWMIEHQLARRNLKLLDKAELALEYCNLLKRHRAKATDAMGIASKLFDIKVATIQKYNAIKSSGNDRLISLLTNEERGINEIYNRFIKWQQTKDIRPVEITNERGLGLFHNMSCFDFMKDSKNHNKFNVVITEPVSSIDPQMMKKFDAKNLRQGYCISLLSKAISILKQIVKKDCYFFFIIDPADYVPMFELIKTELFYMDTIIWHKACIKKYTEPYKLHNSYKHIIMACMNTDCIIQKTINYVESGMPDKKGIPENVIDYLLKIIETNDTYIFDPFAGYGSVISAAYLRRLKAEGCEIDSDIYKIGCEQINKTIEKFIE